MRNPFWIPDIYPLLYPKYTTKIRLFWSEKPWIGLLYGHSDGPEASTRLQTTIPRFLAGREVARSPSSAEVFPLLWNTRRLTNKKHGIWGPYDYSDIYIYIYIYTYLEPKWTLFWMVNLQSYGSKPSKQGSFGFQVYMSPVPGPPHPPPPPPMVSPPHS